MSEASHIKSIRLAPGVTDATITARGLVIGAEKATEIRDWIAGKLDGVLP